jgi:hypothetical protein
MLPYIQILDNTEKMELFWDTVPDESLKSFKLYWSTSKDTTSFVTGSPGVPIYGLTGGSTGILGTTGYSIERQFKDFTLVRNNIPNIKVYEKKYTYASFNKSDIGLSNENSFYLMITSEGFTGIESEPGEVRLVPFLSDQPAEAGGYHSAITKSENFSQIISTDPVRVKFGEDARVIELYNYSSNVVFLDISGFDADASSGMILPANTYYVIDRHVSKDTGFSMVSGGSDSDVRVVVHY